MVGGLAIHQTARIYAVVRSVMRHAGEKCLSTTWVWTSLLVRALEERWRGSNPQAVHRPVHSLTLDSHRAVQMVINRPC